MLIVKNGRPFVIVVLKEPSFFCSNRLKRSDDYLEKVVLKERIWEHSFIKGSFFFLFFFGLFVCGSILKHNILFGRNGYTFY